MSQVFLNGEFVDLAEAKISPLDRGFTFGEGIYEVFPVFSGIIFRQDEHLTRLHNSLSAIYIDNPYTKKEWKVILDELVNNNSDEVTHIYLQVTRGVDERNHYYSKHLTPTVFAMCKKDPFSDTSAGIKAITHDDIRWKKCYIKATTLLPNILLKKMAREKDGSDEAILIRDGQLTEGTASNVFIVSQGRIKTPSKSELLLPGITRDLVIEILDEQGLVCEETAIDENELHSAEEIWITNSSGIAPVIQLDGKSVGEGLPGENWKKINELYYEFIDSYKG